MQNTGKVAKAAHSVWDGLKVADIFLDVSPHAILAGVDLMAMGVTARLDLVLATWN
jgi:hypothetical protein